MLDSAVARALEPRLFTLRVVFFAMLVSLGLYAVVGAVVPAPEPMPLEERRLFELALAAVGVACIGASFFLRRFLFRQGRARLPAELAPEHAGRLLAVYLTPCIAGWALCQAVGTSGLVLRMVGADWTVSGPFLGAAALGLLLQMPRVKEIGDWTG